MNTIVDIIIPTWDNAQYLMPCLASLITNRGNEGLFHVYVVNNGHPESCNFIESPYITVLQTGGKNLGWEGGLKLGLEHSKAPFVCFLNDDTYIPYFSKHWLQNMLQHFKNPKVGAVGPASNVVMGMQNIFARVIADSYMARFLIGFCMLVRREALDKVGGVDDTLPGGDDLDLSIRLRDGGYKLVADRNVFIYHHGFKTGERVYGGADKSGGWNSYEFKEKTDFALIKKHGFRKWYECMQGIYQYDGEGNASEESWGDVETDEVKKYIKPGVIVELGCGSKKTVPDAIGLDMVKKDDFIDTLTYGAKSQADIVADVSKPLPLEENYADTVIARHILEHMVDPLTTLIQWGRIIKKGGKIILAVPDQGRHSTIPMNIEHVSAYTTASLMNLLQYAGFKDIQIADPKNGISFIAIGEKI